MKLKFLFDCPNEIIINVLKYINDNKTIQCLFSVGNIKLLSLLFELKHISQLPNTKYSISPFLASQFFKVISISPKIIIRDIEDLKLIASLPYLNNLKIHIQNTYNYEDFELFNIRIFINHYCTGNYNLANIVGDNIIGKNNRNLSDKSITITCYDHTGTLIEFTSINGVPLIWGYVKGKRSTTFKIKSIQIIEFLKFYQQYTPLLGFNTLMLPNYLGYNELDILYEYLNGLKFPIVYYMDMYLNIYNNSQLILLSSIINNVKSISINTLYPTFIVDRYIDIKIIDYISESKNIIIIDIPFQICDIPKLIQKYPTLVEITIYYQNNNKINDLLNIPISFPNIQRINVYTYKELSLPSIFSIRTKNVPINISEVKQLL